MTFAFLVVAALVAGIGSVLLASAVLLWRPFGRSSEEKLLSFAAGCLLGTAFLHVLPEALESRLASRQLFGILLTGLVFFFLVDKAELWQRRVAPPNAGHAHGRKVSFSEQRNAGNQVPGHCWLVTVSTRWATASSWRRPSPQMLALGW